MTSSFFSQSNDDEKKKPKQKEVFIAILTRPWTKFV